jgi:hypothetical protein
LADGLLCRQAQIPLDWLTRRVRSDMHHANDSVVIGLCLGRVGINLSFPAMQWVRRCIENKCRGEQKKNKRKKGKKVRVSRDL